ncbi:hypothetical protein M446_6968 (plasmid) [Methylobacterium sp. 4-46]|uniref:hypothetical protein n=1 Tax=unclassified Methylobacterium TaxID=2615210 RepID=UPI000152D3EC|nr:MULTISPECIES: hypothetical protein [Methylobacterium]ACA21201.1 hypothetical protein M446_6968 [Methylobacterium sp. 4-46]WFT83771.1 hypothetical protein QA634_35445 [Methylobacterium nodulans]
MTIIDALTDPHLFGSAIRDPATFTAWRVFLKAFFGLSMNEAELEIFRACTGREVPPTTPMAEAHLPTGRRAGKSFVLALIAVYLAAFREYRGYLAPGERATVMVLAADRRQARVIFRYCKGLLAGSPLLANLIERETAEALDLANGVTIEIGTASVKTTRGYSLAAVLCDEIAFWETSEDSASPDYEILNALRPGMATIPGSVLLCASSPYARKGALWDAFSRHFGQDNSDVLVWRAATRVMNPTVPERTIDEAYQRDPAAAAAEYGAEFRSDIESFVSLDVVKACIDSGVMERLRHAGRHVAFVDPSGGSADSMTLAIAHHQAGKAVLDAVREIRPPFSPEQVVEEFAGLMKSYGIREVTGDRYAGEWPRERFRVHGINYKVSEKSKSDLYRDLLPLLNSAKVSLLDHPRLVQQLVALERRTARGGRDSIDHPRGGHDDLANAVAGVLVGLARPQNTFQVLPFPF